MGKIIRRDLGRVVGEVNPGTLIPYDVPEDYTAPMSGDSVAAFMGKVTTDLGVHDNMIRRPDKFDDETNYMAGDYCIRENIMYKFTAAKEAGEWDPDKVIETNINAELADLYKRVSELNVKMGTTNIFYDSLFSVEVANLDDPPNVAFFVSSPNPVGYPIGFGGNRCMVLYMNAGDSFKAQLAFGFGEDKIAIRRKRLSTTWTEWKYFTAN